MTGCNPPGNVSPRMKAMARWLMSLCSLGGVLCGAVTRREGVVAFELGERANGRNRRALRFHQPRTEAAHGGGVHRFELRDQFFYGQHAAMREKLRRDL